MGADEDSFLDEFLASHADVADRAPLYANGTMIGDWIVSGYIGRGGSSEVYCVRHVETSSPAALKILHRTEDRHKARFLREADFLETNASKAFPRFYAKGVKDSRPYIVMELLEPMPLPCGDAAVAQYICNIAEGLSWLHRQGYVHRDIKPRNILSRMGETPVLIDFGLITHFSREPVQADGRLSIVDGKAVGVGTPRYAAPEQFNGGEATPAMDIHALGRLAYDCFGGHPPRIWSRIIRRATTSIPGERYQTVEEFVRAVRRRHVASNAGLSLVAMAIFACAVWLCNSSGVVDAMQWRALGENVVTNVVADTLYAQTLATNIVGGAEIVYPVNKTYRIETNTVDAFVVHLNGTTNVFEHPLKLNPKREYWIVGPGVVDAKFNGSQGTVMRLSGCNLVNRSDESLRSAGMRYILYKNTVLNFPAVQRNSEDEIDFLTFSCKDLPGDGSARMAGCAIASIDPACTKVTYLKTEDEREREWEIEKSIFKARLRSEIRDNPHFRNVDADWIFD